MPRALSYNTFNMTAPVSPFRPFERLVKIKILGKEFDVPENNTLLRCFQYLAPEPVSYGRFCWNEDCQTCRITFDMGKGTPVRAALSCKLQVEEGMRVREITNELKYSLLSLELKNEENLVESSPKSKVPEK